MECCLLNFQCQIFYAYFQQEQFYHYQTDQKWGWVGLKSARGSLTEIIECWVETDNLAVGKAYSLMKYTT